MDTDKYIGRLLDNRYEIQEVIGTGGMAVVYKARCHRLNRLVAIKILKDELSKDEEFRRRFHAESQAVAMLSHPNIVSVYDVSTTSDADYIVMELIDGITLKQYMEKKGVLNWKETLHFAIQIAKALEHAHSRGIVHRDIKPHNVMVLKNGSVKVADFGIARIMSKGNTLTKEALGSVHYISPEQAKGGRVDNRSDIYSLGVVMYEMMSGRPPYDGESPVAVAIQHINGGAPMPSTLNPNIPGGLEQIIMKAMAQEPNDRYDSATAMLYDMDEFRKNPSILFDYNVPPLDDVTLIRSTPLVEEQLLKQPKTTAERVADQRGEQPKVRREQSSGRIDRNTGSSRSVSTNRSPSPNRTGTANHTSTSNRTSPSNRSTGVSRTPARGDASRPAARQQREEEEENRSRVATIAIVACSIVAILAIAIFLITFFGSGIFGSSDEKVGVPYLLGSDFDTLQDYEDILIVLRDRNYSDTYEKGQIMYQNPEAGDQVVKGTKVYVDVSLGEEPVVKTMEDFAGMDQASAVQLLDALQLKLTVNTKEENSATLEKGKVIRTDPAEGTELSEGQTVTLWVSSGRMEIPNVMGMTEADALDALAAAGFKNVEIQEVDSDDTAGTVLKQSVRAYTEIDVTTKVILEVSSGVVKKEVPNVVGKDVTTARQMLDSAGFKNIEVKQVDSDEAKDSVVRQSVNPNTMVDVETKITLEVSNGPTEPPTTAPVEVTKTVTIGLVEGRIEEYKATLKLGDTVVHEEIIPVGGSSMTVTLTGSGIQYYDLYIDDVYQRPIKVDFTQS